LIAPFSPKQYRAWNALLAIILIFGATGIINSVLAQTDLPPIAAPTSSISVGTLPVVRSESQQITDYARGLFEGLMASEDISTGAMVIVSHDRVNMSEAFGEDLGENTPFALGSLSDVFGTAAVLQLSQAARLFPTEDLALALGEPELRGTTLGRLLSHQLDNGAALLIRAVEQASGIAYEEFLSSRILSPLGMANSHFEDGLGILVTAEDMSKFLTVLVGGDVVGGESSLLQDTLQLMLRSQYSRHPALPGWSYGFAEMERNGWRALQRDGITLGNSIYQSRIVLVPELQLAYFVSVSSSASPKFWQSLDNLLFDQLAPKRTPSAIRLIKSEPSPTEALEVAGLYRSRFDNNEGVFLSSSREPLHIQADGSILRLNGAENLVLQPVQGGAWRSEAALIPAAFVDGVFWLGTTAYFPIRAWKRPQYYLAASGIFVLLIILMLSARLRSPSLMGLSVHQTQKISLVIAGFSTILVVIAVILHSWT
jgi:CubicO group peptidase (beta-lactamase class C family)